ncbi:MAG TPA: hypothetical protein VKZ79_21705 [Alphaproteobacteria bacterium]|nr:hypothetical protein [Alphaproteobacteria bacterium]
MAGRSRPWRTWRWARPRRGGASPGWLLTAIAYDFIGIAKLGECCAGKVIGRANGQYRVAPER